MVETRDEIVPFSPTVLSSLSVDQYLIDLSKDYPPLNYSIEINGVPCFPRGDLQAIKAGAKQGKTHTIICLMGALLRGEFLSIKSKIQQEGIWYFATEEAELSAAKICGKVHRLCGWSARENNGRFKASVLRALTPEERLSYIITQTELEKPAVIFIDGIRDLLHDFNSIEESGKVVNTLMRLASNCECSIVCVLHTNKSALDRNMRGHLGTELLNKCSDVLEVKNEDGVFIVEETDCRNQPSGEWAFTLDEYAHPTAANIQPKQSKADRNIESMRSAFSSILKPNVAMSYTDLYTEYMEVAGVKTDAAKKHVGRAREYRFITKGSDDNYRFSY